MDSDFRPFFRTVLGTPFICGRFVTKKLTSPPILSIKDGLEVLAAAEKRGDITSEEKACLLESMNKSGIGEERPTREEVEALCSECKTKEEFIGALSERLGLMRFKAEGLS